jgi:hypothetical protein
MAKKDTLFTSAGITVHTDGTNTVTKVRYGTDFVRQIKMLGNPKKIEIRGVGCLKPRRVDIIELPHAMLKIDALRFLQAHQSFQSPEDQALISEKISEREPKTPRVRKEKTVKVKAAKNAAPSLDSIKSRGKKSAVTVEDVIAAVNSPVETEITVQ